MLQLGNPFRACFILVTKKEAGAQDRTIFKML